MLPLRRRSAAGFMGHLGQPRAHCQRQGREYHRLQVLRLWWTGQGHLGIESIRGYKGRQQDGIQPLLDTQD